MDFEINKITLVHASGHGIFHYFFLTYGVFGLIFDWFL